MKITRKLLFGALAAVILFAANANDGDAQMPLRTGWRTGGSLGVYTVAGVNANTGVGATFERLHLSESGFAWSGFLQGSIHGSNVIDPAVAMALIGGEVRYAPMVGQDRTTVPFVGARLGVGLWSIQVPNAFTLENTSVTAYGEGFGLTAGVLQTGSKVDFGLTASHMWMFYGDAATEAFVFSATDSRTQQFTVSLSIYVHGE